MIYLHIIAYKKEIITSIFKFSLLFFTQLLSLSAASVPSVENKGGELPLTPFQIELSNMQNQICSLDSSSQDPQNEGLSYHWAQMLIGSDLLREDVSDLEVDINSHPDIRTNWIAIFDNIHQSDILRTRNLRNLISGKDIHAVLPDLLEEKKVGMFYTSSPQNYIDVTNQLTQLPPPSFVSNPVEWNNKRSIYYALQFISQTFGPIIVTTSGNRFLKKLDDQKIAASRDFGVIVTGGFGSEGFAIDSSQQGEDVFILAPSNFYITSTNEDGTLERFNSGTAGASTLVTATLAIFEWLSGYHPSPQEAKQLLKLTAIPTLHSHEIPRRNGVGVLNTYKIGRLGYLLSQKCPNKDISCFQRELRNRENYYFHLSPNLAEEVTKAFPNCPLYRDKVLALEGKCEDKIKAFNNLRRAILLSPEKKELWETLGCIYKEEALHINAQTIDNIAMSIGPREEVINRLHAFINKKIDKLPNPEEEESGKIAHNLSINNNPVSFALFRVAHNLLGEETGNKVLTALLNQEGDLETSMILLTAAMTAKKEIRQKILHALAGNSNPLVRKEIIRLAEVLGPGEGSDLLDHFIHDPDTKVKLALIHAAMMLEEFYIIEALAVNYLQEATVKIALAEHAVAIGGNLGRDILVRFTRDSNPEIRDFAIDAIEDLDNMWPDSEVEIQKLLVPPSGPY